MILPLNNFSEVELLHTSVTLSHIDVLRFNYLYRIYSDYNRKSNIYKSLNYNKIMGSSAYDVYVLKTSGVPLVSGCTGSKYCMEHAGQHELQSGFLAALNSFSQEAFDNENIRVLEMENIQQDSTNIEIKY